MIELSSSVCIDAPAAAVWARLRALEQIPLWSAAVKQAWCAPGASSGVGAVRSCALERGIVITEHWTEWDEGRSFRYEATGVPLVRRAANRWSIYPHGGQQALLMSYAEIELKGGWLGRLFEPLMVARMQAMGARSLAAFKYLVEHGQAYSGPHAELPVAPAVC